MSEKLPLTYAQQLQSHIEGILTSQTQLISFYEIICNSEGAYPTEVLQILKNSDQAQGKFFFDQNAYEINRSYIEERKHLRNISEHVHLADPHPVDFDWRFNSDTISALTHHLSIEFKRADSIALLGTKTLFQPLEDNFFKVSLFTKSQSLIDDIKKNNIQNELIVHDLAFPLPNQFEKYSVVIADPPWYTEFYEAFITRSAALLKKGGAMYVVFLPLLTRPFANEDCQRIKQFCFDAGFDLEKVNPVSINYETPFFELNSLRVSGIYCKDWRKGDLLVFRKTRDAKIDLNRIFETGETKWEELRIANKKIKIKDSSEAEVAIFAFEQADPSSPFLSHVSRRASFRHKINFWTSDNLALSVSRVSVLKEALIYLTKGYSIKDALDFCQSKFTLAPEEMDSLEEVMKLCYDED